MKHEQVINREHGSLARVPVSLFVILLAGVLVLPPLVGFRVDFSWLLQLYSVVVLPALTIPWIVYRKLDAIRAPVEVTVISLAMLPPILVLTYVAMRLNFPLADPLLVRMDQMLWLDWPSFIRWVDRSPTISTILDYAYASVFNQIVFLPALLCMLGFARRAYMLVSSYALLVMISCAIAAFFPSEAAYRGYGFPTSDLANIDGTNGYLFLRAFHAIRDDPNFLLNWDTSIGILTFPSVHAGVAALLAWAAWPSKILRVPFLVINVLMAIGAITHGAHYFVDIIAGIAVAALSAWLAVRLHETGLSRRPRHMIPAAVKGPA